MRSHSSVQPVATTYPPHEEALASMQAIRDYGGVVAPRFLVARGEAASLLEQIERALD